MREVRNCCKNCELAKNYSKWTAHICRGLNSIVLTDVDNCECFRPHKEDENERGYKSRNIEEEKDRDGFK